jgi:hypothetical protein
VALWVKRYLAENPTISSTLTTAAAGQEHRFFVSDLTPNSEQIARDFLGHSIRLELPD